MNAWHEFCSHPRSTVEIEYTVEQKAFWEEIEPFVKKVGQEPTLVVSGEAAMPLYELLYPTNKDQSTVVIERNQSAESEGSYIGSVHGVNIFRADFEPHTAWLFSGLALRTMGFAELDIPGSYVELSFEPGEDHRGRLRLRMRQAFEWNEAPIYDLRFGQQGREHRQRLMCSRRFRTPCLSITS